MSGRKWLGGESESAWCTKRRVSLVDTDDVPVAGDSSRPSGSVSRYHSSLRANEYDVFLEMFVSKG